MEEGGWKARDKRYWEVRKPRVMVPELRKVRQKKPGWPRTYWDESILDSTALVDPLSTPGVLSQVPYQSLPPAPGDTHTHPTTHPWIVLQRCLYSL